MLQEFREYDRDLLTRLAAVTVGRHLREGTKASVRAFQSIFGLPATGIVDYATWFKISDIFVGVSKIAELA